jgi:hypothetical protein
VHVRVHLSMCIILASTEQTSVTFDIGDISISQENPDVLKIGQKNQELYMKTYVGLLKYVVGQQLYIVKTSNWLSNNCCILCQHSVFLHCCVTNGLRMHNTFVT